MAGPDDARRADQIDQYTDQLSREMALAAVPEDAGELQKEMHNIWERLSAHVLVPDLTDAIQKTRAKTGLKGILSDPGLTGEIGIQNLLKLVRPQLAQLLRKQIEVGVDRDLSSRGLVQTVALIASEGGNQALLRAGKEIRFTKAPLRDLLVNLRTERELQMLDTCPSLAALRAWATADPRAKQAFELLRVAIAEVDPRYGMLNIGGGPAGGANEGGLAEWSKTHPVADNQIRAITDKALFKRNDDTALLQGYLRSNPNHLTDLQEEHTGIVADPASPALKRTPRAAEQARFSSAADVIEQIYGAERECHLKQVELNGPPPLKKITARANQLSNEIKILSAASADLRRQFGVDYSGTSIPPDVALTNIAAHKNYLDALHAQATQLRKQATDAVDTEGALSPTELLRCLVKRRVDRDYPALSDDERNRLAVQTVAGLREKLFGAHRQSARQGQLEELAGSQAGLLDRRERNKNKRRLNEFLEETVFGDADTDWQGLRGVLTPTVSLQALIQHGLPSDKMKRLIETFDLLLNNSLQGGGILDVRDQTKTYDLRNRLCKAYLMNLANEKAPSITDPAALLNELLAARPQPSSTGAPTLTPQDPEKKPLARVKNKAKIWGPKMWVALQEGFIKFRAWQATRKATRIAAAKASKALPPPPGISAP